MKNLNNKKIFLGTMFFFVSFLIPYLSVFAIDAYTQLEPQAFAGFGTSDSGNPIVNLLGNVFNFGIAAAVALALIMIVWGGIEYMTTDSWEGKNSGKERITEALYGLGMALISYLILFTINPCLVDFTGKSGCATKNTFLFPPTRQQQSVSGGSSKVVQPCPTCTEVTSCKPGANCGVVPPLADKLNSVLSRFGAQMTEGWPPTDDHISTCHYNGTCADVNLLNKSTNPADVLKLFNGLKNAGLTPLYEVPMPETKGLTAEEVKKLVDKACGPYRTLGITCQSYDTTSGQSFHVK